MRRLPIVILTWTLFAAVMLAIGWVLKQVVPPALDFVASYTGWAPLVIGLMLFGIIGLTVGVWPRDAEGRMRRLTTRP